MPKHFLDRIWDTLNLRGQVLLQEFFMCDHSWWQMPGLTTLCQKQMHIIIKHVWERVRYARSHTVVWQRRKIHSFQKFLPITQYLKINPKPQRWMPGNTKAMVLCVVILKKSYCKLSKTLWSTLKLAKNSDQTKTPISIFFIWQFWLTWNIF